jgi:hypothetical protein
MLKQVRCHRLELPRLLCVRGVLCAWMGGGG